MRKLIALLLAIGLFVGIGFVIADDYTVALSTYSVDSGGDFTLAGYPNISGGCKIDKIILANSAGADVQIISWYDTATSTTAATVAGYAVIGASTTVQIDFPSNNPANFRNFAAKKSSTGSTVNMTVQYR